ncbi:hypothetical protein [Amycolatopsis sp. NPDC059021]|uniref:hypothetical protein n=1 Tax=Amycolatopsis sp. NPDC059021 TaxID=3346704 RepID=UPI00366D2FAB
MDTIAEKLAARWAEVTDLELAYSALRAQHGVTAATRALIGLLETKEPSWNAECLAAAVAALDDVRRTGELVQPVHEAALPSE